MIDDGDDGDDDDDDDDDDLLQVLIWSKYGRAQTTIEHR